VARRATKLQAAESAQEQNTGGVRTLERGLAILSCFDVDHRSWTIAALGRKIGLHKATARRVIKTLEAQGFLLFDAATGEYRLGSALLPMTYLVRSHEELVRVARPYLQRLADQTEETVGFSIWTDAGIVNIDHIHTTRFFKPALLSGSVSTVYGTAHSKILLAFGPEERLGKLTWSQEGRPLTMAETLAVREELERVRATGIAYDLEERNPGVCALAVPVWDGTGEVTASIAVVVPPERFTETDRQSIAAFAVEAGEMLSRALGYRGATSGEVRSA